MSKLTKILSVVALATVVFSAPALARGGHGGHGGHGGGWHHGGGGWHGGWRGGGWGGGWGWGVPYLGYYGPYYYQPYYYGGECGWVRVRVWRKGHWVLRRAWRCW